MRLGCSSPGAGVVSLLWTDREADPVEWMAQVRKGCSVTFKEGSPAPPRGLYPFVFTPWWQGHGFTVSVHIAHA